MREENDLVSDTDGNAVTVAYVQKNMTGKSYAQHQHSAPASSAIKPPGNKKFLRKEKKKYDKKKGKACVGKCCFKCGKEGHFIA